MKYYAVPLSLLRKYGMGDESWRKRKGDDGLANEAEVMERLGYQDPEDFEEKTGARPMTLSEARKWTDNH